MKLYDGGHSVSVNDGPASSERPPFSKVVIYDEGATVVVNPPPPATVGKVHAFPLNRSRMMCSGYEYAGGGQYFRYDTALMVYTDTFNLLLTWNVLSTGGGRLLPLHPQYGVVVAKWDDFETQEFAAPSIEIGRYIRKSDRTPPPTGTEITDYGGQWTSKSLSAAGLVPGKDYVGWYVAYDSALADAKPTPILDNPLPFYFHYNPAKNPLLQTHILYGDNSFDWTHGTNSYHIARVPMSLAVGRAKLRRARLAPQSSIWPTQAQIWLSYSGPIHTSGISRQSRTKDGFLVSAAKQGYFKEQMRSPYFEGALMDGPRGRAMGGYGLGLRIGRNGGKYVFDGAGAAFVRYLPDDTRITIAGFRDDGPIYWPHVKGHAARRLVGDWSAVPNIAGRRQFNNVWGWCWDQRTTAQGAPTNTVIDGEPVHDGDVVSYCVDRCATGGRMLEIRERGDDPNRGTPSQTPPSIREVMLPGSLNDPFALEWWPERGVMLCAERKAHGISIITPPPLTPKGTPPTGMCAKAGWFMQNPNGASLVGFLDDSISAANWDAAGLRTFYRRTGVTVAQCQAVNILGPECIVIKDNRVFYSGGAQQDIRVTDDGIAWQRCCAYTPGSNKFDFMRFAVSDGSFFPDNALALVTFDNASPALTRPTLYKPIPTGAFTHTLNPAPLNVGGGAIVSGRGDNGWNSGVYPVDVAFSRTSQTKGMLCWTDTADSGPAEVTLAQADDPPASNKAKMGAGWTKYEAAGHRLLHGDATHGFLDIAFDPGTDADLIYYRDQITATE